MNLVDVLVLFTAAPPLGPPKLLLKVLKEVKLPSLEASTSCNWGPKLRPNGPKNGVLRLLLLGWLCLFNPRRVPPPWKPFREKYLNVKWILNFYSKITNVKEYSRVVIIIYRVYLLPANRSSNGVPPKNSLNTSSGSLNTNGPPNCLSNSSSWRLLLPGGMCNPSFPNWS